MQREALQRRKCDCWHLIFCTDFTRSAPLGSQSGTSLPRRDRNIPKIQLLLYLLFSKFSLKYLLMLYLFRTEHMGTGTHVRAAPHKMPVPICVAAGSEQLLNFIRFRTPCAVHRNFILQNRTFFYFHPLYNIKELRRDHLMDIEGSSKHYISQQSITFLISMIRMGVTVAPSILIPIRELIVNRS